MHSKDRVLPLREEIINNYLCVGSSNKHGNQSIIFEVRSIKDLSKIIQHFDNYPLITNKRVDYELFKQAFNVIKNKEHLTMVGLSKLVAIKFSMNRGLSDELKVAFQNVVPVARPLVNDKTILDPN